MVIRGVFENIRISVPEINTALPPKSIVDLSS